MRWGTYIILNSIDLLRDMQYYFIACHMSTSCFGLSQITRVNVRMFNTCAQAKYWLKYYYLPAQMLRRLASKAGSASASMVPTIQVHLVAQHLLLWVGVIFLRTMLNPKFSPGFKLVCSGSVEEQDMFWENIFTQWFTAWPEHAVHYSGAPQEQDLSDLQQALLKFAIQRHQRQIKLFIYANTIGRETRLVSSTLNNFFKVKKLASTDSVDAAMMAYDSPAAHMAALAMSQSGCTGCPSKRPKLVRHTPLDPNQPSNHVDRHRIFSLQPSGQVGLRTSYIPTSSPEKEDENIPLHTVPADSDPTMPTKDNPWNEMEYFDPASEVDNVLGVPEIPMAKKRRRRTAGDDPTSLWLPERQMYMNEFLRLEGRGQNSDTPCDCFSVELACRACTIRLHHNSLFHRIKEWKGGFFHPVSLKSMGLRIQLGHPPGTTCCRPTPAFGDDFVIIDVHVTDPRMAATFAVLKFFCILSFKSKVSAFKFYHSLARRTDNTGITPIHIDANFRLKRRMVSTDQRDPGLSQGWGYFIDESEYKWYLSTNSETLQEKSNCVSHNAVNMADMKSSRGLAATGVGTVDCARHDMKLANGVSDLQKGEKYLNMDYLVFSALARFSTLSTINFSYDIACQWHKKLWDRLPTLPPHLQFNREGKTINFFVPKFHIAAHIESCQTQFSFNWTPGVGWTDGEAPECGWANINRVASSTKEMGPGARCDTLNDQFSNWNWKKITALGKTMLRKMTEAIIAEKEHHLALWELESSINDSEVGAASLAAWRMEIEAWEMDRLQPNPFQRRVGKVQGSGWVLETWIGHPKVWNTGYDMTQATVRLELAQRDANELEDGSAISLHAEVTCSVLISTGIDLEDAQCRLRVDSSTLGQHATDIQRTKLYQFKVQHLRGQGPNTCARKTMDAVEERLMLSHAKYASAHEALLSLAPHLERIGWEHKLQPLKKTHLRPIGDLGQQTQGTVIMLWIWLTHGISSGDSKGLQDSLHIKWCKARGDSWESCATLPAVKQPEEKEGMIAYACRQAHIRRGLVAAFAEHWKRVPQLVASNLDDNPSADDVKGVSLDAPPCEYIKGPDE
ncbi:hypothetical protein BDR06DRAFT_976975 [Suillus hirtellus]|nr:hypothetical protein BDR06DRAFT_976975 [Suillus hirtellus]